MKKKFYRIGYEIGKTVSHIALFVNYMMFPFK